jgi:hypothetical protein
MAIIRKTVGHFGVYSCLIKGVRLSCFPSHLHFFDDPNAVLTGGDWLWLKQNTGLTHMLKKNVTPQAPSV